MKSRCGVDPTDRHADPLAALGVPAAMLEAASWGAPDLVDLPRKPTIPLAAVNSPDGARLIALSAGGCAATIRCEMEEGWFRSLIPEVTIPGATEPDRLVLLHGHCDSWDVGVENDAPGDAAMRELARVLWAHRTSRRRSAKIAWWPGHSTGRHAGSTRHADRFALGQDEQCVAQVNCDSPGCRRASTSNDVSPMAETEGHVARAVRAVTGPEIKAERPHRAGDRAFNDIGLSSFLMLSSTMPEDLRRERACCVVGGCCGNIAWRTERDLIEIADRDNLLRDMKVYPAAVVGVANAPVMPFDGRAMTATFAETIDRRQKDPGDLIELAPAAEANRATAAAPEACHGAPDGGPIPPARANAVIQRLARIPVPLNHALAPRFGHDPALPAAPLPALAVCEELAGHDPDTPGFAQTQALRGRNRVVAALREAERLVRGA